MRHGFVEKRPKSGPADHASFTQSHVFRPFVKALGNAGKGLLALSLAGAPAAVAGTLSLLAPRTAKAQEKVSLQDMLRWDKITQANGYRLFNMREGSGILGGFKGTVESVDVPMDGSRIVDKAETSDYGGDTRKGDIWINVVTQQDILSAYVRIDSRERALVVCTAHCLREAKAKVLAHVNLSNLNAQYKAIKGHDMTDATIVVEVGTDPTNGRYIQFWVVPVEKREPSPDGIRPGKAVIEAGVPVSGVPVVLPTQKVYSFDPQLLASL